MADLLPRAAGVLGHNARALHYTNQRQAAKIARSKLTTKRLLQRAALPTPRLYATITSRQEIRGFRWTKLPASFVIKPNSAMGGGGILIVFGRNKKGNWVKADKTEIPIAQLKNHLQDILDGSFSPANVPDKALIEQRVKNHPDLKPYSVRGIADIRVIVYNLVPVMAMLRLPTVESHGKANLHAGGIGVGIDLVRGRTTTATYRSHPIETVPGSRLPLAGLTIPHWRSILLTACRAAQAIELPFAGVDLAIDRDDGPLVLEINARPGLDIQLANLASLRSRLRRVEGLTLTDPAKGVRLGQNLFGSDVEQEIEEISGQIVLAFTENVAVQDASGTAHSLVAKIDTGAWRTTIDAALARQFGIAGQVVEHGQVRGALGHAERPIIKLTLTLRDKLIKTNAYLADRSHMTYPMIIGRRDLGGFLIDPSRKQRR
ncbi:MAG TPA: sugar-transfer associated ATP-grasp domain-containing protein [Candidatus Andersenbacteria bacterium]|nr:sugar-transfer associated ATP-grasp domain-containing protein [Candidatus Andersenbacteria bacterium]